MIIERKEAETTFDGKNLGCVVFDSLICLVVYRWFTILFPHNDKTLSLYEL